MTIPTGRFSDPALLRMWCQVCGAEAPDPQYADAPKDCACGGYHWASYPKGAPIPDVAVEHGPRMQERFGRRRP